VYWGNLASEGSTADGNAGLRKRPPKAAAFRGIGIFPTSNFRRKFVIGKPITLLAETFCE